MIKFLEKIFTTDDFVNKFNEHKNDKIDFYYKQNQEYFIVSEYDIDDINDFFRCERTSSIVWFLDNFKKENPEFEWIDKDTSLIITLKVPYLQQDFESLKNQIMKIEEDEYFFRKYIIIYDKEWEKGIENINTIEKLNNELRWIDLKQFRENNFTNSKWYLIAQLFIKLPFLEIKTQWERLKKLSEIIDNRIASENLTQLNRLILDHKSLTLKNKNENKNTQEDIQKVVDIFLWEDDQKVEEFFNKFTK